MKELKCFKSVAAGVLAAKILILGASLTVSCSTDVETSEEQPIQEGTTFPIYVRATNGGEDQTRAVAARQGSAVWIAENGEEDINPEGWNDPLGESVAAYSGKKKTQYSYNANRNTLEVLWNANDEIGIKALSNASGGSVQWTKLSLTEGGGMKVANFEGLASTANGLSPTGSQDIVSVYPYNAEGNYNLATQSGTIDGLGAYDIRVDTGTIVNGTVTDLYYTTRISVLRIATTFFDEGDATKTKGKTELTVTVNGAGIGNQLTDVCSTAEQTSSGSISATVAVDPASGKPLSDVYIAFVPIDTNEALFTIDVQSGSDANIYSRYTFYKSHFSIGKMYNLKHPGTDISETAINFECEIVKAICLQNFDTDKNGEISYREAREVRYLGQAFANSDITKFNELEYFTNLSQVPSNAFAKCIYLESVQIPSQVTIIGNGAFEGCKNLKTIGSHSVESIGDRAFYECEALASVDFPNCTKIRGSAFVCCLPLRSVSFPACTTIGDWAFLGCEALTSVDLPVCTTIGELVFSFSSNLTSISLPAIETIGSGFELRGLGPFTLDLGPGLTQMAGGEYFLFRHVVGGTVNMTIICRAIQPPTVLSDEYMDISFAQIYVPAASVDVYKAAPVWSTVADRISALP